MSSFDRVLTWIENGLAALALGGAGLLAILQVILRAGFGYTIFWTEEATVYLIILSTFIGAVITLRHNEHVNFDVLAYVLKGRARWGLAILGAHVTVGYCAIMGALGWLMITDPAAQQRAADDHPGAQAAAVGRRALPIGLTLMLLRSLEALYRTTRRQEAFPEANENEYEKEVIR